jgi:hypothetical protein
MESAIKVQGRTLYERDLIQINQLIADHPQWHRTQISRELCQLWRWCDDNGQLKDMACRSMLLKLHARDLIKLPAPRRLHQNHSRSKNFEPLLHDSSPLQGSLAQLGPIDLQIADRGHPKVLWQTLLHCYHYLGFTTRVGKNIAYLASDSSQRPLAAMLFGAAAWKCAARDTYIGWSPAQREANLHQVINNTRFLIAPFVQVPHLASHLLGAILRRLPTDWLHKYGHRVVLVETFVEKARFQGTCYRAANWIDVGQTTGRTRSDRHHQIQVPIKRVFLRPVQTHFKKYLISP